MHFNHPSNRGSKHALALIPNLFLFSVKKTTNLNKMKQLKPEVTEMDVQNAPVTTDEHFL